MIDKLNGNLKCVKYLSSASCYFKIKIRKENNFSLDNRMLFEQKHFKMIYRSNNISLNSIKLNIKSLFVL